MTPDAVKAEHMTTKLGVSKQLQSYQLSRQAVQALILTLVYGTYIITPFDPLPKMTGPRKNSHDAMLRVCSVCTHLYYLICFIITYTKTSLSLLLNEAIRPSNKNFHNGNIYQTAQTHYANMQTSSFAIYKSR